MRIDQADTQSPTVSARQITCNMNLPSGHTYEFRGPWTSQPHRLYPPDNFVCRTLGEKHYELTDHLGNVRATVADRKVADFATGWEITGYTADISSANDYYPFGWTMPGRQYDPGEYRYGFQGQEKDDEIKGAGNSINYKFRMYSPRIGRFFSEDPLTKKYPFYSPYAFSGNRLIDSREIEGLEPAQVIYGQNKMIPMIEIPGSDQLKVPIEPEGLDYINSDPNFYGSATKSQFQRDFDRELTSFLAAEGSAKVLEGVFKISAFAAGAIANVVVFVLSPNKAEAPGVEHNFDDMRRNDVDDNRRHQNEGIESGPKMNQRDPELENRNATNSMSIPTSNENRSEVESVGEDDQKQQTE